MTFVPTQQSAILFVFRAGATHALELLKNCHFCFANSAKGLRHLRQIRQGCSIRSGFLIDYAGTACHLAVGFAPLGFHVKLFVEEKCGGISPPITRSIAAAPEYSSREFLTTIKLSR
jgi:hypothetical protein